MPQIYGSRILIAHYFITSLMGPAVLPRAHLSLFHYITHGACCASSCTPLTISLHHSWGLLCFLMHTSHYFITSLMGPAVLPHAHLSLFHYITHEACCASSCTPLTISLHHSWCLLCFLMHTSHYFITSLMGPAVLPHAHLSLFHYITHGACCASSCTPLTISLHHSWGLLCFLMHTSHYFITSLMGPAVLPHAHLSLFHYITHGACCASSCTPLTISLHHSWGLLCFLMHTSHYFITSLMGPAVLPHAHLSLFHYITHGACCASSCTPLTISLHHSWGLLCFLMHTSHYFNTLH